MSVQKAFRGRQISEVAPGRLLLRFRLYLRPAAGCFADTGALGVGKCFGIRVGAYIGGGQFVLALPAFVPGRLARERTDMPMFVDRAVQCRPLELWAIEWRTKRSF